MTLHTKDEILDAVTEIQYLYGLKYEIRYELTRTKEDFSESVAEHIYGMHVLCQFFLPLEDVKSEWNHNKIRQLITWHDIEEVETGDMIGWKKTDADRALEKEAGDRVVARMPKIFQKEVGALLNEYNMQETIEARFVKALDKVEPLFHIYNPKGKILSHHVGLTFDASNRIKEPYVASFPHLKNYSEIIQATMAEEGFFVG
jgi:putative hydrolase of HD superfamily